jgi:hypothetical protein
MITSSHAGETHFIPRFKLTSEEVDIPFPLHHLQFQVNYFNQQFSGSILHHVGLDLRSAVFTHGQFYVTVSRATSVHRVKAIWNPDHPTPAMKNIVYHKVLQDE